jgi:sugar lactone lactonase YvrE
MNGLQIILKFFRILWFLLWMGLIFKAEAQFDKGLSKVPVSHELKSQCQLGEGAFWDEERQTLWFVDIEGKAVWSYLPGSAKSKTFPTNQRTGTVVPARNEDMLVLGLQTGVYSMTTDGKQIKLLGKPSELGVNQRFNDGKADPKGRFWVGSMQLDKQSEKAHLFSMHSGSEFKIQRTGVTISNGLAWSKDTRTFYYIDTPTRKVLAFDYDSSTNALRNERILAEIPDSLGWPDGMTLDANDDLWIGMWGGFCVTHWSGKTGAFLGKIRVPAPNVTSCAFGGPNLDQLWITTARQGLSAEQLKAYPESGDVFLARPGINGRQMPYWLPTKAVR